MLNISKYLRISITNKCNYTCYYCHREGNYSESNFMLTPQDLHFVCQIALENGFTKFKITGGEPTVRPDICEVIKEISSLNLPDLSMITNGTRLAEMSKSLWDAGLHRLNITLNTIDPNRLAKIQLGDKFKQGETDITRYESIIKKVFSGIEEAQHVGFKNIKLNFVYFDDNSKYDLEEVVEFSKSYSCIVVLLPILDEKSYSLEYLYKFIQKFDIIKEELVIDDEGIQKKLLYLKNGARILLRLDEVNYYKPYVFCNECSNTKQCREGIFPIRLSSDGKLIPCMANQSNRIDIVKFTKNRDTKSLNEAFKRIKGWHKVDE